MTLTTVLTIGAIANAITAIAQLVFIIVSTKRWIAWIKEAKADTERTKADIERTEAEIKRLKQIEAAQKRELEEAIRITSQKAWQGKKIDV